MATVEEERPSSSSSTFSQDEVDKLMSQGKRHFVCNQIMEAVKCFQEACRMLGEKYGQTANECGDAYYQYGKSLLELARVENGVLGNALQEVQVDVPDSDEETKLNTVGPKIKDIPLEEKEALSESVKSAMEEKQTTDEEEEGSSLKNTGECSGATVENPKVDEEKKTDNSEIIVGERDACKEDKPTEQQTNDNKETEKHGRDSKEVTLEDSSKECKEKASEERKEVDESEDIGDQDEKNDDDEAMEAEDAESEKKDTAKDVKDDETVDADAVPTIQLAWEMLELARIIFKRNNNQESQLKLAQAHSSLGELHMEQEQFSEAVIELTKCLNIQKLFLKPDDRLLAETYYNLGLSHGLSVNYEESAKHYGIATEVLELRMKNIKERMTKEEQHDKGKGKASEDDPYVKDRKELAELEELLPEVKEKCLDAKNVNEKLRKDIKEQFRQVSSGFGSSSSLEQCCDASQSTEEKKANDISHLIRRSKRKPEDEEQTGQSNDTPSKKSRQDDETATSKVENGDMDSSEAATMEPEK